MAALPEIMDTLSHSLLLLVLHLLRALQSMTNLGLSTIMSVALQKNQCSVPVGVGGFLFVFVPGPGMCSPGAKR
jgi:hypothetical protein